MSWSAAMPKLKERLRELATTNEEGLAFVHQGPPANIHNDPFVYFFFASDNDLSQTRPTDRRYFITIVAGVKAQDMEKAEAELAHFVDNVPPLFYPREMDDEGHPKATLGGAVTLARLTQSVGVMPTEQFPYRHIRYTLEITDKTGG